MRLPCDLGKAKRAIVNSNKYFETNYDENSLKDQLFILGKYRGISDKTGIGIQRTNPETFEITDDTDILYKWYRWKSKYDYPERKLGPVNE